MAHFPVPQIKYMHPYLSGIEGQYIIRESGNSIDSWGAKPLLYLRSSSSHSRIDLIRLAVPKLQYLPRAILINSLLAIVDGDIGLDNPDSFEYSLRTFDGTPRCRSWCDDKKIPSTT